MLRQATKRRPTKKKKRFCPADKPGKAEGKKTLPVSRGGFCAEKKIDDTFEATSSKNKKTALVH
jgi:hypothetical protein